jgi:hypothetical protein
VSLCHDGSEMVTDEERRASSFVILFVSMGAADREIVQGAGGTTFREGS